MKIGFHSNQLGIRGTEVALYDYAVYNQTILGNESYIFYPEDSDVTSLTKFQETFLVHVFDYSNLDELQAMCEMIEIDVMYWIKSGVNDGKLISGIKNVVHAVFDGSQPHGDRYAAVSKWLGDKYKIPYVPHIVSLPEDVKENYRKHLGIPEDALVFGRYGGVDQFDLQYLREVIPTVADKTDYWFLFMNTNLGWSSHPRVKCFSGTTDLEVKTAFINTCDAMLHGRSDGESFGLSICEFLHQNKPVITNINGRDQNQMYILQDKGYYYSSANELLALLFNFKKKDDDYASLVKEFAPEPVMQKFKQIFLS